MEEQQEYGKIIKQIHCGLTKNANKAMCSQKMTTTQLDVLTELDRAPEKQRSIKELETILHVAQSTASGIIIRLEQKGFVESISDPADRRIKLVRITQAGIDCANSAKQSMREAEEQLFSGLTKTERDTFLPLLKKVRDSLR